MFTSRYSHGAALDLDGKNMKCIHGDLNRWTFLSIENIPAPKHFYLLHQNSNGT